MNTAANKTVRKMQ